MNTITAYTDGACSGNGSSNARAGAAAILIARDADGAILRETSLKGKVDGEQTSNRAEIQAVILALESLNRDGVEITIVTDSNYVFGTMTDGWKRRRNYDLWSRLDKLVQRHQVTFEKCAGHSGHEYNERADVLAKAAINR
jgi:ribonuclease HI